MLVRHYDVTVFVLVVLFKRDLLIVAVVVIFIIAAIDRLVSTLEMVSDFERLFLSHYCRCGG